MAIDFLIFSIIFIIGAFTGFFIAKKSYSNNFDKLSDLVKKEFALVAAKQMNDEQSALIEKNQSAVKLSLEPLSKQIDDFKKEINTYRDSHSKNTGEISQKLSDLTQKSIMLSQTAQNLSDALTQNRNVKGWYGENLALTILENSGFIKGVHFETQCVESAEDSKILRPDFEVYLPDNRAIIIDSKAILSSIVEIEQDDEDSSKKILSAVKTRVKELASKQYHTIKSLNQPEFVLMYIPIEPIVNLLYTTKEGMDIINFSRQNKVVITGSVSLVTVINLIDWLWKENDRIQNLDEIISTGTKLYDAVAKHAEELIKIQRSISDVKDLTDSTLERLVKSSARINVFKEAEKLKNFGITSPKQIPETFVGDCE